MVKSKVFIADMPSMLGLAWLVRCCICIKWSDKILVHSLRKKAEKKVHRKLPWLWLAWLQYQTSSVIFSNQKKRRSTCLLHKLRHCFGERTFFSESYKELTYMQSVAVIHTFSGIIRLNYIMCRADFGRASENGHCRDCQRRESWSLTLQISLCTVTQKMFNGRAITACLLRFRNTTKGLVQR